MTDLQKVLDQTPRLGDHGIDYSGLSQAEFDRYRQELSRKTEEFRKTCKWLSTKKKRKTINMKHTSYGLKHIAEKDIGYITNGIFIAAAISCRFDIKYNVD